MFVVMLLGSSNSTLKSNITLNKRWAAGEEAESYVFGAVSSEDHVYPLAGSSIDFIFPLTVKIS